MPPRRVAADDPSSEGQTEDEDMDFGDFMEEVNEDEHTDEENAAYLASRARFTGRRDATQPKKTRDTYNSAIRQWKTWCDAQNFPVATRYHVNPERAFTFLEESVYGRSRLIERSGEERVTISYSTLANHVSALVNLWNDQRASGNDSMTPRSHGVRQLLITFRRETHIRRVTQMLDRAIGSPFDTVHNPRRMMADLACYFISRNSLEGTADNAMMLSSLGGILRGETVRVIEFADLFLLAVKHHEQIMQSMVICQSTGITIPLSL